MSFYLPHPKKIYTYTDTCPWGQGAGGRGPHRAIHQSAEQPAVTKPPLLHLVPVLVPGIRQDRGQGAAWGLPGSWPWHSSCPHLAPGQPWTRRKDLRHSALAPCTCRRSRRLLVLTTRRSRAGVKASHRTGWTTNFSSCSPVSTGDY